MRIEICVDSVAGAIAAAAGGADRVELCDNLLEGGTTPSAGSIRVTRQKIRIGLQVIIRPRGGDFLYTRDEFSVMREDITIAKELGADGVVIGVLTASGAVDTTRTAELADLARPMNVTFHRAFDMCRDGEAALEDLIALRIDRVLTSGQESSCLEGIAMLARLQRQSAGRIVVMPGGGITPRNVQQIVQATGVQEIHLSARTSVESGMEFRNTRVFMGGTLRPPEFSWKTTDAAAVSAIVNALNESANPFQGR